MLVWENSIKTKGFKNFRLSLIKPRVYKKNDSVNITFWKNKD